MAGRSYEGKVVAITGAAGGLGQALCRRFAQAGARIAAIDLNEDAVSEFTGKLNSEGYAAKSFACDVTDWEVCESTFRRIHDTFGGIDVLINNAGISHRSYFKDTDVHVIHKVMNVNFFGSVHCTKAALSSIIERQGQILAISSIAGFSPLLERTGYSASKHALHGFFDSLRAEVEDEGVDVMIVCPAFVATGIEAAALAGDGGSVAAPRRTIGKEKTPQEMAGLIFDAASETKRLALPTPLPKISWWVSRLAPKVFSTQMKRRVKL